MNRIKIMVDDLASQYGVSNAECAEYLGIRGVTLRDIISERFQLDCVRENEAVQTLQDFELKLAQALAYFERHEEYRPDSLCAKIVLELLKAK